MHVPFLSKLRHRGRRTRGQSVVEFALILPVLLLLTLTAMDFGRIFLGWVNVQQMTRIAANEAAEHASAWVAPIDTAEQSRYRQKIANDARLINCTLPNPIPDPVLAGGTALGAQVQVTISCRFNIITPIISNIVGGSLLVTSQTTFPVKEGAVATVPGGGSPIAVPPTAKFVGSPQSGWAPLTVVYTDQSTGTPSSWTWDFNVGATTTGIGVGSASPATGLAKGPNSVIYTCTGNPGDTCTFGASLTVQNAGGTSAASKSNYITVTVPPATGPIAEFTGTPRSGVEPLTVNFQFTDLRGGTVTYTNYEWDFTGDGTYDATGATANHTYPTDGAYDVVLRVTASGGATSVLRKTGYIVVTNKICTVPDFANTNANQAQNRWSNAGFTTTVLFQQGNYNKLHYQSILGGTVDPQPAGCDAVITVGP
jgi:PKD repeat protein